MYTSLHTAPLCAFINESPSPYHAVDAVRRRLLAAGYRQRTEGDLTPHEEGGRYFVLRSDSSLIAYRYSSSATGFRISAAHTDAPSFRVKPTAEKTSGGSYTSLEVERYGGMIHYTWLDRPLSVAGRVLVRTKSGLSSRLVNIDRDIALIPSVAIHLNRGVNDGYKFNPAVDLLPLISAGKPSGGFMALLAEAMDVCAADIVSYDLFLYNREQGRILGEEGELLLCPRLDDLACVYACLEGFLADTAADTVPVLALFHNEEVGSSTKQGAASTFLVDTLSSIGGARYGAMLTDTVMVSADNAHAKHPNHPELSDPDHAPVLGGGLVIKYNASERYTTDALSDAIMREVCRRADLPVQSYCNRADLPGGSTLGSIANTRVSVPTVDIGLAQLAMHAANESCDVRDVDVLTDAMRAFYTARFHLTGTSVSFI